MENKTPAKTVESWLIGLDASLSRYANDFRSLDYCNTNTIKYFVAQEFENFTIKPSNAHRRMLLNAVAKMQTPTSRLGLDSPMPRTLIPRRLDYSSDGDYGTTQIESEPGFVYKSPVELMLSELEENLDIAEVELSSLNEYVDTLKMKYCDPNILIDKTRTQCSKCHLREGHNRNKCMNGVCEGPESCNDLDKHPAEKKIMNEAVASLRSKQKEVDSMRQELSTRKKAVDETQASFKYKVQSALINTNLNKYTFETGNGRAVRQTAVNNDLHILEKHFKGKVPANLHRESKNFQQIINAFNKNYLPTRAKSGPNPARKNLEARGVRFPNYHPYCASATGSDEQGCSTWSSSGADHDLPPKKRRSGLFFE
ncbi:hypothetical protein FSP39_016499 [Pinctada imbricata]|uniref:SAM domain-containing protein n=1 Tax=Pinctada imbricata TaxID=66713 RepID=A0AA89C3I0_PINIB|nr:hypothetical protein FSP39_016499 [Pinctada imbricata]